MNFIHTRADHETPRYVNVEFINVNHKKLRKLSQAKIRQYLLDYERGDDFPPITVEDCNGFFTVRDGRHRYQAQLLAGHTKVSVVVY